MKNLLIISLMLLLLGTTSSAGATLFTASDTTLGLSASANFQKSGSNLIVTLTNTSPNDIDNPAQVLTALFFTVAGNPTLTPTSALLTPGSTVFYDPQGQPLGGNVGGEWAYKNNLSGAPNSANAGISSSGLDDLFGQSNFNGPNLADPNSGALDGVEYGILSAGDDKATGNGGITGSGGLIKNSVTFTLAGLQGDALPEIDNVLFQYGTSLDEPNIPSKVPEPGTLSLLGSGLVGIAFYRRRRK